MKIIPIFVENTEGLHSIQYPSETRNEFDRLFDLWNNYQYLFNFCKENAHQIFSGYYKINRLEEFIDMIVNEANELESVFLDYYENGNFANGILQTIFMPYHNQEYKFRVLQLSKASIKSKIIKQPALRLYALRIDSNTFIITGGCIKITKTVQESDYNLNEIKKLEQVRQYLLANGIQTFDDLIYYYER
jgi:hypothetical protein